LGDRSVSRADQAEGICLVACQAVTNANADDSQAYVNQVRAEIEAEAEARRRRDPELQRREREIERVWIEVAPPGAAGDQGELLLDRADRLATIDVDVPLGAKPGIRQLKGAIRKVAYWYLRYVSDQVNALNNVLTRLLRRFDERLSVLEDAVGIADGGGLLDPIPEPDGAVAELVASILGAQTGRTVVLGCGSGVLVRPLHDAGIAVHGVDVDALVILPGVRDGLDLRAVDPGAHLAEARPGEFGSIVAAGFVEDLGPASAQRIVEQSLVAASNGTVVIVTGDPAERGIVERELRAGRGLSPATWAYLFERTGAAVELVGTPDPRFRTLVVARLS
jgi:hypothetical protein